MDIGQWLRELELEQYAVVFEANDLDQCALPALNGDDLKELGIASLGHRKKILAAIERIRETRTPENLQARSIKLDSLPSVLALPLAEYFTETNPVLKLWHACDVVELALRLVVTLGLADIRQQGELPAPLLGELQGRIEEPTLGKWKGMALAVAKHVSPASSLFPELPGFVNEVLVTLLDGPGDARTPENSFSALRNQLAHGGGITRGVATRLLPLWAPRFESACQRFEWMNDIQLVVRDKSGRLGVLRGPSALPSPLPLLQGGASESIHAAFHRGDEVLTVRKDRVLPIWPMTLYGLPAVPDPDAAACRIAVPQLYVRRGEVRLAYTPVGSDEVCHSEGGESALEQFLRLFRLDTPTEEAKDKTYIVRGFEADIRRDAGRVIGRETELQTVREKLDEAREGRFWLTGPAGIGKSYLIARIAAELIEQSPSGTLVLAYRFKSGDDRCSRTSFLDFALERLRAWKNVPAPEEEAKQRKPLKELAELLADLGDARVLFVLDGLDEIAVRDSRFASEVPLGLNLPGVVWFCVGRPEQGLAELFTPARCTVLFPDGLSPMGENDIRAMILEKIGPLRKRLLANDREQGDTIVNPFVRRVTENAVGLPLYVSYVIGDILSNRYRALDVGERLPQSLEKYHEELLRRCAVGVLHQVVTPLAATIAVAHEALTAGALGDILVRRRLIDPEKDEPVELVKRGLAAIASMLRRARTPDGREGFTLYHHSLKQHMEGSREMASPLGTARGSLAEFALEPGSIDAAAAPYLFRHGIKHLVEVGKADTALDLLCRFDYVMDRLQMLQDVAVVPALLDDWRTVANVGVSLNRDAEICESFFREKGHILRRGNAEWPAYKIFLQLAVEHADDSPLTIGAEKWLADGRCGWPWLRRNQRIRQVQASPCLVVFEGHTGQVDGAFETKDGRFLSWSDDGTLRLWDQQGNAFAVLEGHCGGITGAIETKDGRFLSWSKDKTLRFWDQWGKCIAVLRGHSGGITGAIETKDGRFLSWSKDKTLRFWNQLGKCIAVLKGHSEGIKGAIETKGDRILSWSYSRFARDKAPRLWDPQGNSIAVFEGHSDSIEGALETKDGRFLSWPSFEDKSLRLWNQQATCTAVLQGHSGSIEGAIETQNGRFLSWSADGTLRLWDQQGNAFAVLEGHIRAVKGAIQTNDGRYLSWSNDKTLRLWNDQGACIGLLEGHSGPVGGAVAINDGRFLSWASLGDKNLRLWDPQGNALAVLDGHSDHIKGVIETKDGRFLSWSSDGTLRLWDPEYNAIPVATGHTGSIIELMETRDGRFLSWSYDKTLRLWDHDGNSIAEFSGHSSNVKGAVETRSGCFLSWAGDATLRLWNPQGGCLAVLDGHLNAIWGVIETKDGRFLSWAYEKTLRLWDPQGNSIAVLEGHSDSVGGVIETKDGRFLSWSSDKTLRLWDNRGICIAVLEGHLDSIWGAFEAKNGTFVSWSGDKTIRLWDQQGNAKAIPLCQ